MKHIKTFESFLNEADTLTEVQETVEIKQESEVWQSSPYYDFSPIMDALKTFKKPDIKTIVFDIPQVCTITVDAAGIRTEATSSNLKKAMDQGTSYASNTKYFGAEGGFYSNMWYSKNSFDKGVQLTLGAVLRAAYMYDIKWPIEVPVADADDIASKPWARENPSFDPINNEGDYFIWISQFPQVPIKPGTAIGTKESNAVVKEVIGLSPKTIKVTITGMRSA